MNLELHKLHRLYNKHDPKYIDKNVLYPIKICVCGAFFDEIHPFYFVDGSEIIITQCTEILNARKHKEFLEFLAECAKDPKALGVRKEEVRNIKLWQAEMHELVFIHEHPHQNQF